MRIAQLHRRKADAVLVIEFLFRNTQIIHMYGPKLSALRQAATRIVRWHKSDAASAIFIPTRKADGVPRIWNNERRRWINA